MNFTCFDKFMMVLDSIPDEGDRMRMALAIIEYGTEGKDPGFGYPMSAIFEGMREDIDNSRDARANNKGGRPRGSRNKAPAAPPAPAAEVSCHEKNGGSENEKPPFPVSETPVSENGNPIQANTDQANPGQSKENPLPPFPDLCLMALNEELGTAFTTMPAKCRRTLERSEGAATVEEVREMVRHKRDEFRGTQFRGCLTPNTLFSPDHFEQYVHQAREEGKEAARYACYD